jgi:hypothetical protein
MAMPPPRMSFEPLSQTQVDRKVREYEQFATDTLKRDLAAATQRRACHEAELQQWQELEQSILQLQEVGELCAGWLVGWLDGWLFLALVRLLVPAHGSPPKRDAHSHWQIPEGSHRRAEVAPNPRRWQSVNRAWPAAKHAAGGRGGTAHWTCNRHQKPPQKQSLARPPSVPLPLQSGSLRNPRLLSSNLPPWPYLISLAAPSTLNP